MLNVESKMKKMLNVKQMVRMSKNVFETIERSRLIVNMQKLQHY